MSELSRRQALMAVGATVTAAPRLAVARIAIVDATLHRAGHPPLEHSVVVLAGERIVQIAERADFTQTSSDRVIDGTGKILTAGLVDPLTRIGVAEIDLEDGSHDDALVTKNAMRAAFAVADGYNPASALIAVARREGLTSVGVTPTGGLVMGQSAWADLIGDTPEQALAQKSLALHVLLDDPTLGDSGLNRASALYRLRALLEDARTYRNNRAGYHRAANSEVGVGKRDLEVVVRALEGKLRVVVHVDRAADILNVLALAKDNGLALVLASVAEGWKVRDALADADVPCIVYPLDDGPRNFTALGAREDNAAMLHAAGVTIALATGESHNARKLRQEAGNAVRAGLPWPAALDAVTDAPARIFGLDATHGSPTVGRLANLALWTDDPFELSSRVQALFIRGREVSLRTRQTVLFERHR
ncbi:MAG: hypothetical protein EXR75_13695 [Myxococcales bacterium]|nr:hypothetical protein [Myxococcales bacterium]